MKKTRIAMILPTLPQLGGSHQYAMLLMKCLMENKEAEYELVAICHTPFWRTWCRKNGIRCIEGWNPHLSDFEKKLNYRFPFLLKIYNSYFTSFGKLLAEKKIDILFSTSAGVFIPNYNVKKIVPVHDLMHRYERRFPEVGEEYEYREIIMKSYARYADCILVDSKLGKKQFRDCYLKNNAHKPRIVSLPFIVPEHIYNREEEPVNVPDKYVFYPAQFWKHKNHINLVKAIAILKECIKDIHLVLVGSEKNACEDIKKFISDNGLSDNITILGFVSDEAISYLYSHAVALVMPSYFGPTNIPPLEAMALGCPVAVSNKYAMPEQVGDAGMLFDPDSPTEIAECIRKLWYDEDLREKLKALGYDRINKWTKRDFNKRLQIIIKKLL